MLSTEFVGVKRIFELKSKKSQYLEQVTKIVGFWAKISEIFFSSEERTEY